ncbi:MAG: ATP-dependent helicase, partial [Candidatus Nanopelagicales bacterium]|nr:ATP-dependent helicase [Candidatus Nanopelagicales bacterium]
MVLDEAQQRVVDHAGGPMLVLAGPGTGKTATIVESVVARLEGRGCARVPAERVLALTFGRRAAAELRTRIALRIGNGVLPVVATVHSFAFGMVRRLSPDAATIPRLLTAPEQERRLRELFTHAVAERRVAWPTAWQAALGTAGLAAELRQFITRADVLGMTRQEIESAGRGRHVVWSALAAFRDEYLDVLGAEGVVDYVGVINAASAMLGELSEPLFDAVYVDEYQDTDPSQVRMVRNLVLPSTTLVAVGDPDQAIYRFRGADVGAIRRFRDEFHDPAGAEAPIVVLRTCRRSGSVVSRAARQVIGPVSLAGLPASAQRDHRSPLIANRDELDEVRVIEFPSAAQHAVGVARLVVAARDGRRADRWSDIAVLVRSAVRDLPPLARAMSAAGIPVAVPGDNILLRDDPSIAPVLAVLRVAAELESLSPQMAAFLAQSPLGGLSPTDLRVVTRELTARLKLDVGESRRVPEPAEGEEATFVSRGFGADLLAGELRRARPFSGMEGPRIDRLRRLAGLIVRARELIQRGSPAQEVLWSVWSGSDWPDRLVAASGSGGAVGRNADRVLDAAVALFFLAGRVDGAGPGESRGTRNLLDEVADQEIPAGLDVAGDAPGDRVSLMTAHRSKGLEWPVVVVAGVQEGLWPDVRGRSSLLATDELGTWFDEPVPGPVEALADERRLFFVACTRACRSLTVTCVKSPDDGGSQPSRFVSEVLRAEGVEVVSAGSGGAEISTVPELLGELRWTLARPDAPPNLRARAEDILGQAAQGSLVGLAKPLKAADPANWWNKRPTTDGGR